jgi:hypothetical protein
MPVRYNGRKTIVYLADQRGAEKRGYMHRATIYASNSLRARLLRCFDMRFGWAPAPCRRVVWRTLMQSLVVLHATMHNTHRVPIPAAIDAEARTLWRHTPSRSCANPARLHIDVTFYSSLHRRITWFSVPRVLAKSDVRHGDTLVLLSDEQIM